MAACIANPTPRPATFDVDKVIVWQKQTRAKIRNLEGAAAQLEKSRQRWKKLATVATLTAVVAIGILALVVWFHPSLRASGTTTTATTKNTATQETAVIATTPVGSNDKNVANLQAPKAPVAATTLKSTYESADGKVKLEIKNEEASLEVTGKILNDDEFTVVLIEPKSKKDFPIGELDKKAFRAGVWRPQFTIHCGAIVEIRRIGTKEPICEKAIVY